MGTQQHRGSFFTLCHT